MNEMKAGELRTPGVMTTIDGTKIDLVNCVAGDFDIRNIAWGLGRTMRYGGHIREEYTVAMHSIVMSYLVPEGYAKEALLHDAAEAYTGDIIWPMKAVLPAVDAFEKRILNEIMKQFEVPTWKGEMSKVVKKKDIELMEHECFEMGIRPGIFRQKIDDVWLAAAIKHEEYWFASQYAFLQRFDELFGTNWLNLEELTKVWFPDENQNGKPVEEERSADQTLDLFMDMMCELEEEQEDDEQG